MTYLRIKMFLVIVNLLLSIWYKISIILGRRKYAKRAY